MKKLLATIVTGIFVFSVTAGSTVFAADGGTPTTTEKGWNVDLKDGKSFTSNSSTSSAQATAYSSGTAATEAGVSGGVIAAVVAGVVVGGAILISNDDSDAAHGHGHGHGHGH